MNNDQMYETTENFIASCDARRWPDEVVDRARMVALDTMAVMIRGYREKDVATLAAGFAEHPGGATLFTRPARQIDPLRAILCNTSSAAALELCEGNRFTRGHVALQVLPALLAAAEIHRVPGSRFLPALILGYDIAARMGSAAERHFRTHGHGMWAAAGSSVAISFLLGRPARQTVECLKIASNLSLAPAFSTHAEGATVRNVTAGLGGMLGYLVPDMQAAGYLGSASAMAVTLGETLGSSFSADAFTRNMGQEFLISSNYFKFEASGRHMHATTGALEQLLQRYRIPANEVERIEVATYHPASSLTNQEPINALAAKTSIPYSVAALLVFGDLGTDAYDTERIHDPRVRALMRRVQVGEDQKDAAQAGQANGGKHPARSAQITVSLKNGDTLSERCENPRGEFDFPAAPDELRAKYDALTLPVLGADASARMQQLFATIETVPDIATALRGIFSPG